MKKRNIWGLTAAFILAAALLLTAVPSGQITAHAEGTPAQGGAVHTNSSDILSQDSVVPDELNTYPEDVYGKGKGRPFLLSEQDELCLLYTDTDRGISGIYTFDEFDLDQTERDSNSESWINGINSRNAKRVNEEARGISNTMYDMQSVAFDADGTGRKSYVASVYLDESKTLKLSIQKPSDPNGPFSVISLGEDGSASQIWALAEYVIDNVIAITAGDYDGDGKDTVIVYICNNGDNVVLKEFKKTKFWQSEIWMGTEILNFSSILKETRFTYRENYKFKPAVTLTTGDFNGDGRDQLAFSAGFYNTSEDKRDGYVDYSCNNLEQFATCIGIGDCNSSGWSFGDPIWMYDIGTDYTGNSNSRTYPVTMMHGGSITSGDVDNDGIDEIIAAGYVSLTKGESSGNYARVTMDKNGKVTSVSHICDYSKDYLVSSIVKFNGVGYQKSPLATFEMSGFHGNTHRGYCNDQDWVFTRIAMGCAKINGCNQPEYVFIDDGVYSVKSGVVDLEYRPSLLEEEQTVLLGSFSLLSSVNWVRHVAVGNFDGNEAGREQFVFTLWQKYKGYNNYYAFMGVIAGVEYQDELDNEGNIVSYGPPEGFGSNLRPEVFGNISNIMSVLSTDSGAEKKGVMLHYGASTSKGISAVPVAVDVDDDGVIGRFSESGYVYTDPIVLAVLQAGPYYGEIAEAGGYSGNCTTSYSISSGFTNATSYSDNVSFEVGIASEVSAGPVKVGLEAGYTMDWSHSFETAYTVTSTITFTAEDKDLVALHRIPVLIYTYDIWDPAGSRWITNGMHVRIPLAPSYYLLDIDEYNAFVDEYNAIVGADSDYGLIKIRDGIDLPSDNEGNPNNYWSSWASAGENNKKLSSGTYTATTSSGSIGSSYTTEAATTESQEVGHGFHFGLTIQGGGDFGVAEVWAGGYANLDYSHSTGTSTTKIDTTESGGVVQNIDKDKVEGLTSDEVASGYGFQWEFGKWTRTLQRGGEKTPFYGYIVLNPMRRALPPQLSDWEADADEGYSAFNVPNLTSGLNDVLTVTKVSGNDRITYDDSTKSIRVEAGLAGGTYPVVFRVSNGLVSRDTEFTFTLKVTGVEKWMHDKHGYWYKYADGSYPKNQWAEINGKWYHFDANGYMQTEWLKLSGKWYYLGTDGAMKVGWKQISGKWYYFKENGVMKTGWEQISGKWYYFTDTGAMAKGWKEIDGLWYYFADSGAMAVGWKTLNGQKYYFRDTGAMATSWVTIGDQTYFFKQDGTMAASEWCQGWWLNANGTWTYPYKGTWRKDSKGWWFGDESGWYAKNTTITINGKAYSFDARGYWIE